MNRQPLFDLLAEAYRTYWQDVDACRKNLKPTDGLFGLGHSLADDACHDRFDRQLCAAVQALRDAELNPDEAETAVRMILEPDDKPEWPQAAQWMLRAAERHALLLIPFLSKDGAARLCSAYASRYKPWDRLPAQREVYKALKSKS